MRPQPHYPGMEPDAPKELLWPPRCGSGDARLAGQRHVVAAEAARRRKGELRDVVLPQLGVYKPIWKYDLETLRKDLSAHLVFGTATEGAFCLLAHGEVDK